MLHYYYAQCVLYQKEVFFQNPHWQLEQILPVEVNSVSCPKIPPFGRVVGRYDSKLFKRASQVVLYERTVNLYGFEFAGEVQPYDKVEIHTVNEKFFGVKPYGLEN